MIQKLAHLCLISIHALLAESDRRHPGARHTSQHFYPRSPCGERQFSYYLRSHRPLFLSTLSLRRATLGARHRHAHNLAFLSTLSLRRATKWEILRRSCIPISIHALLAESDCSVSRLPRRGREFLSTLSLRRATPHRIRLEMACRNFYPRSPCGERHPASCRIRK